MVLLTWALFDFAVPGVCLSDWAEMPPVDRVAESSATPVLLQPASPVEPEENPLSRFLFEDDCFCCCTHIVPRPHFSVAHIGIKTSHANPPEANPVPLYTYQFFHPPRN